MKKTGARELPGSDQAAAARGEAGASSPGVSTAFGAPPLPPALLPAAPVAFAPPIPPPPAAGVTCRTTGARAVGSAPAARQNEDRNCERDTIDPKAASSDARCPTKPGATEEPGHRWPGVRFGTSARGRAPRRTHIRTDSGSTGDLPASRRAVMIAFTSGHASCFHLPCSSRSRPPILSYERFSRRARDGGRLRQHRFELHERRHRRELDQPRHRRHRQGRDDR